MDASPDTHDVESAGHKGHAHMPTNSVAFIEAAALLTIWSLLVINEGSIRLNDTSPSVDLFSAGRPSKAIVFFAALSEVIFGLIGLFVGVSGLVLRWYNTAVVKATMVIQTILGYYVFVVYVFVIPIFMTVDLSTEMIQVAGLTLNQNRVLLVMGLLTSFNFCLALQGGQFVFMARLIAAGTGQDFLRQNSGAGMRAVFWNANLSLAGLWTLITGAIIVANADESGRLPGPYVAPPNVGVLPGMTIWTGIVMLVWGVIGIVHALSSRPVAPRYYIITAYVYVAAFLNYGIVQFGLFEGPTSGAVALHNGLVFMVVFMGAYFVNLKSREMEMEGEM